MKDKKGFRIEDKGYDKGLGMYSIEKVNNNDKDFYIHNLYRKGVSFYLDRNEMEVILETITDEENQKKMKEELILIRLQNEVENKVEESLRGKKETEVCMS